MSLSTITAVPLRENGQDGNPGTVPLPVTVYGTFVPLSVPDAAPLAEMPFVQVAENVPAMDVGVWLVTCHEKPLQELAEMPDSGFDDQVPSSDGALGDAVVVVDGVEAGLGASTFDDSRSKPVHALVTAAMSRRPVAMSRFIVVTLAVSGYGRSLCKGDYKSRRADAEIVIGAGVNA